MAKKVQNTAIHKDAPQNARKTAARLFGQLKNQCARLIVVAVCIVIFIVLNIFTPYYSAGVIDALLEAIAAAEGGNFSIPWYPLGQEMIILFSLYIVQSAVYYLQSFLMASVAEVLILTLRKQIAAKLNKLSLKFFDRNKPGEILSRVTSDLDKVSETLQTGLLKLLTSMLHRVHALPELAAGAHLHRVFRHKPHHHQRRREKEPHLRGGAAGGNRAADGHRGGILYRP